MEPFFWLNEMVARFERKRAELTKNKAVDRNPCWYVKRVKQVIFSSVKMLNYILQWATFKQSTLLLSVPLPRFPTSKMFLRVLKGCFCCSLENVCSKAEQVHRFQDFLALPSLETLKTKRNTLRDYLNTPANHVLCWITDIWQLWY